MMGFLAAFLASFVATGLLSHVALRIGWIDQLGSQGYRKLRKQPVALVGGAAILVGVLVALILGSAGERHSLGVFGEAVGGVAWPGLLGAFFLGVLDDVVPDGLPAGVKFGGQLVVAVLVAWFPGSVFAEASALECVGLGVLALVAMNAVNLFDHADGLAGLLCAFAMLAGSGPLARLFAAGALGYLPFNLFIRHSPNQSPADVGEERSRSAPFAMLGDSGSHLVGVLLATTPGAWWFLALPILDMVRVAGGRLRRQRPIWRGDRTHVGHLLGEIGFSPVTVAMLIAVALAPLLVTIALMDGPAPLTAGLLAGAALYFGMLVLVDGALPPGALDPDGVLVAGTGDEEPVLRDVPLSEVYARASGTAVAADTRGHEFGPEAGPRGGLEGPSGPFAEPPVAPAVDPQGGKASGA